MKNKMERSGMRRTGRSLLIAVLLVMFAGCLAQPGVAYADDSGDARHWRKMADTLYGLAAKARARGDDESARRSERLARKYRSIAESIDRKHERDRRAGENRERCADARSRLNTARNASYQCENSCYGQYNQSSCLQQCANVAIYTFSEIKQQINRYCQ